MILNVKRFFFDHYLVNYVDAPRGTGKIIPLVVIESMALCVSYFISIYLVNSLHFSPFQVGKLISALSLGTCVGALLSGYLTTKISVIKVSAFGLFTYAIGFFLLSFVTSYPSLLIILFLCGLGGVFMMIANLTALSQKVV
jgi:MFS family permease